jgi:hypothetical protein
MLILSVSTDWPAVKTEIQDFSRTLPAFKNDFIRMSSYLDQEIKVLSNLEVENRRTKTKYAIKRCSEQVDKINQTLDTIQQMYLMSILSN